MPSPVRWRSSITLLAEISGIASLHHSLRSKRLRVSTKPARPLVA